MDSEIKCPLCNFEHLEEFGSNIVGIEVKYTCSCCGIFYSKSSLILAQILQFKLAGICCRISELESR